MVKEVRAEVEVEAKRESGVETMAKAVAAGREGPAGAEAKAEVGVQGGGAGRVIAKATAGPVPVGARVEARAVIGGMVVSGLRRR